MPWIIFVDKIVMVQFYICSTAKSFINVVVSCLGGQVIVSANFANVCRATSNARLTCLFEQLIFGFSFSVGFGGSCDVSIVFIDYNFFEN